VNRAVVRARVSENLARQRRGDALCDFGQIALVVVRQGPAEWLVRNP
jgi:hypothetical protein